MPCSSRKVGTGGPSRERYVGVSNVFLGVWTCFWRDCILDPSASSCPPSLGLLSGPASQEAISLLLSSRLGLPCSLPGPPTVSYSSTMNLLTWDLILCKAWHRFPKSHPSLSATHTLQGNASLFFRVGNKTIEGK